MKKNLFTLLFLALLISLTGRVFAQDVNIVPYLKQIEKGDKKKVEAILPELKKQHPDDPSVMFLDGILTENGQEAVAVYNKIIQKYPRSRYADAALYRVYSYYYALGMYSAAKSKLLELQKNYPQSPYIEIAKKNIPQKDSVISVKTPLKDSTGAKGKTESVENNNYPYTIQAGAFSVSANAESLKKSFMQNGYYSRVEDKVVAGTTFHIVFVGRFNSEDDARKTLQTINSKFNIDGRVIKTN